MADVELNTLGDSVKTALTALSGSDRLGNGAIDGLGTAATTAATDYATAAQGTTADTAVQPAALSAYAPLTITVGTALGTTGTVALDLAALNGTTQRIDATGDITFTASNYAAGRTLALRIDAGGSVRTLAWPAWTIVGEALPTSLASGKVLRVAIECVGATAAETDASKAVQL